MNHYFLERVSVWIVSLSQIQIKDVFKFEAEQ